MLFDSTLNESCVATDWDSIQESKYDLGIEGAYMHMYENQCNFNAMMKAVGLSELAYYRENGQSLFVNEAGAVGGFISKAKEFFKKVLEKIKGIIKKFIMIIQSYTMDDKKFVKKYEKDLLRVNTTDFEFNGYNFKKSDVMSKDDVSADAVIHVDTMDDEINKINATEFNTSGEATNPTAPARYGSTGINAKDYVTRSDSKAYKDSDAVNDRIEMLRGRLVDDITGNLTEDELREEFHDKLYGEDGKTTLECGNDFTIGECLEYIRNTEKSIKSVKKFDNETTKTFNKLDKALSNAQIRLIKVKAKDNNAGNKMDNIMANLNGEITVCKAISNSITMLCGMLCTALKDRNRQCKAICVKAINYKHESAMVGGYADDSMFGNVVLK